MKKKSTLILLVMLLVLVFAMPVSWMLAAAASLVYLKVKGLQQSQIVESSDS